MDDNYDVSLRSRDTNTIPVVLATSLVYSAVT